MKWITPSIKEASYQAVTDESCVLMQSKKKTESRQLKHDLLLMGKTSFWGSKKKKTFFFVCVYSRMECASKPGRSSICHPSGSSYELKRLPRRKVIVKQKQIAFYDLPEDLQLLTWNEWWLWKRFTVKAASFYNKNYNRCGIIHFLIWSKNERSNEDFM